MKQYTTYELIKSDIWRYHGRYSIPLLIKTLLSRRTFRPVLSMRLCNAAHTLPVILKSIAFPPLLLLHRWYQDSAGIDLPWRCSVGPGFRITHGWGLVIHDDVIIGNNVTVFHGVTIGSKRKATGLVAPVIGNEVTLSAGAIVIGEVHIGDGAIVGAGAIVTRDVAPYSLVVNEHCKEMQSNIEPRVSFPFPVA